MVSVIPLTKAVSTANERRRGNRMCRDSRIIVWVDWKCFEEQKGRESERRVMAAEVEHMTIHFLSPILARKKKKKYYTDDSRADDTALWYGAHLSLPPLRLTLFCWELLMMMIGKWDCSKHHKDTHGEKHTCTQTNTPPNIHWCIHPPTRSRAKWSIANDVAL